MNSPSHHSPAPRTLAPASRPAKVRLRHLAEAKASGWRFSMLTSYDAMTARIFEEAGIDVLLVGDSAGTTVLGYESTVQTTHQEMLIFTGAVARAVRRPLIVADLAFGTYQVSVEETVRHAIELMRAGAHAVKLEGGAEYTDRVRALVSAGIPVMGHLGFTPQSVNALSGHRVQGRDHAAADRLAEDARALQDAGVFAIVLELVPAEVAARITEITHVPTIGIGAGPDCDGQVLVWADMAGLSGFEGRFVRTFADLRGELGRAAADYRAAVETGQYPGPEHSFE